MPYSFQIVTASALERRMVLQKHWKRLEKEAEKDLQPRKNTRKMKKRQIEQKNNASDNDTLSATSTMGKPEPEIGKPEPETDPVVHVPVAQYVTEETDLLQLLRDNLPVISIKGAGSVNFDSRNNTSVLSTNIKNCKEESESPTHAVTSDKGAVTDSAIDVGDDDGESSSSSLMLTGLHTCGNLTPNIFRIFLANPEARVLCNVGCCYQLLTEEFWTEDGYTKGKPP